MALPISNVFDGGTDGVAVSTGNSGGASGDAVSAVSVGSGSTLEFDTAQQAHGGVSMLMTQPSTGVVTYAQWGFGATSGEVWGRVYLRFDANPSVDIRMIRFLNGSTVACSIALRSTGTLRFYHGSNGNTAGNSGTTTLSTNTWYRIEFHVLFGTPTAGVMDAVLYTGDSTSAIETLSQSSLDTGTVSSADTLRLGNVSGTTATAYNAWYDSMNVNATAFPGPDISGPAPDSFGPSEPVAGYARGMGPFS